MASVRRRRVVVALGTFACVASGCAVERIAAVQRIGGATDDAGDTLGADGGARSIDADDGGTDAPPDVTTDTSPDASIRSSNAGDASDGGLVSSSCTAPAFVNSSPGGGWSNGGYFVFNNVWDTDAGPGPQTLYACSYHSWYVVSDQADDAGLVESYPNVQMTFNGVSISSFNSITSTFAERSPHVGVYEDAYDIWLNGVATPGSTQILIWVDNDNRVPDGSHVTTTTLGDRTYDVWMTSDGLHIVLEATAPFTSGTVDLLQIIDWAINQTWLSPDSTLGQIDFGVEIVSTGGANATYYFDDFSIDTR
jgi:Glycosyl hydrolase family 12